MLFHYLGFCFHLTSALVNHSLHIPAISVWALLLFLHLLTYFENTVYFLVHHNKHIYKQTTEGIEFIDQISFLFSNDTRYMFQSYVIINRRFKY
jgi:hypothetical protein